MRKAALLLLALASVAQAQRVTSPKEFFGHDIGADYVLPNYRAFSEYWKKLDTESPKMKLEVIGKTEEGRDQLMAIVTSEENHRKLTSYKQISTSMAMGSVTAEAARRAAKEGKAVVWIDGGLHASEVLGAQQLMETLYQTISRNDEEMQRILDNVIILFVHANPDGMDLLSDWYMRNSDPQKRSTANVPRLYQKYIGHDNNRDFYASTQKETENMNRVMYREWYPQIMYNHHQTGPAGTVMFAPPFRPPFNHHVDPLVMSGVEVVGSAMHNRFIVEDKPGVTMRTGAGYSAWWNGGLRTTAYFHNTIGILTETIGSPTPMRIPFVGDRQIMNGDLLFPIEPQEWKFRQSVDYSVTANMAILDLAAKKKEDFLYGMWKMARNSVEKGRKDTWTNYPSRVAAAVKEAGNDRERAQQLLRKPELRDAKVYIINSHQRDFPTAVKFVNALIETGVQVQRMKSRWGNYSPGSLVISTDQAYRPHILDMFEPQDHPHDVPVPGAPPIAPYDSAGWTLAYQMGVEFTRLLDRPQLDTEPVSDVLPVPAPTFTRVTDASWVMLSPYQNDSFSAVQDLIAQGVEVRRASGQAGLWERGAWLVELKSGAQTKVDTAAKKYGLEYHEGNGVLPASTVVQPLRIGLWDRYGGSMESGWLRWMLEQWGIPFKLVFAPELDAGDLRSKYDVLIFPDGAIPPVTVGGRPGGSPPFESETAGLRGEPQGGGGGQMPADIPAEFHHMWGRVTAGATIPQLRAFLEAGGRIVAIGGSTNLAYHLKLPIENALVDEQGRPLARAKYYVPASVLQARVDNTLPIAWGMRERADFMFDNSPVFRIKDETAVKKLVWFDTATPLRSGWAWGQEALKDTVAGAEAKVGNGTLYLFGPEITFRAQPHGTFKLLFNALFGSK